MPNGETCPVHTALAVQVGQHETRLDEGDRRMSRIEDSVERIALHVGEIQKTLWRLGGALATVLLLLRIFGDKLSQLIP